MSHPNTLSTEKLADFFADLAPRVAGDLRTDLVSRTLYSTDASIYRVMPYGVFLPRDADDIQAAVETAARHQVPLLPRSAGSSLVGQAVNEALVIDVTRHLDRVVAINAEERWVRVQPGVVLDQLNLDLRPHGLQFGPDPASSNRAAMGGIISNNATGSHSILYGMAADHVLAMDVILGNGARGHFAALDQQELAVRRRYSSFEGSLYRQIADLVGDADNQRAIRAATPRHWRRCGGYNLDRLLASADGLSFRWPQPSGFNLARLVSGAEGTLAVITELTLGLVPLPKHTALAVVHFDSLFAALSAVPVMLEAGPSAVELLDNLGLTMCREVPEYARLLAGFIEGRPNCVLITEFTGESEAELRAKVERLQERLQGERAGATAVVALYDAQGQANVWTVRKVGLGLLMSIKGDFKPIPFIEDAAVPVAHLAEYVTRIERFCNDLGTDVAYYAHASAGCVHIRPLINTKLAAEVAKLPEIASFSVELLRGYGGAFSSEHGDGRARSWLNERFFGPELFALFRQVKRIFDPDNILNPGNIVDPGPMTENLRFGADYRAAPLPLQIDWRDDLGFDRAVEMCNGAGICRKLTTGTMCPSFMVTREEEHSTRGRANMLRAAMSGQLPEGALASRRMFEVMDLCVECKACASECPSSVDMAKIKLEFLGQYYEANGTPLRPRLFGDIARWSRLGSGPQAGLVNSVAGSGIAKAFMDRFLGISKARTLPAFAHQPFTAWFKERPPVPGTDGAAAVVLFNDTFNTYNTPEVAIAATELLEAAGFRVILPGHACCGRPMISKGLVEAARAAARSTVDRLAPLAEQGLAIVGLEPSCLLSIKDEYRYLLPDDPRVDLVARHAVTFEEFMARLADDGRLRLSFREEPRRLLLHGHCHQKALVGTGPSKRALSLPPQYVVEEVDSGCCGMAGAFGYEAEHYEISMAMAERRLLPAVREAGEDTIVVAAGISCRQQIEQGTGRRALHPAQVLRQALK